MLIQHRLASCLLPQVTTLQERDQAEHGEEVGVGVGVVEINLLQLMHGKHLAELWVRCILRYFQYRVGAANSQPPNSKGTDKERGADGRADAVFSVTPSQDEALNTQCDLQHLPWQYTL